MAGSRRRLALLVVVLAGAVVAVAAAALGPRTATQSPDGLRTAATAPAVDVPAPVTPAFRPGRLRGIGSTRELTRWAAVRRPVRARTSPSVVAAVAGPLGDRTPEGTPNTVVVSGHAIDSAGRAWVHVWLPVLPNGTSGWVPRSALGGYQSVRTRLDVDLRRLRATLYRNGRALLRMPVGVGKAGWQTPRGTFHIRNRLTRYSSPTYGPIAFGTSARSPQATDWPAGGFVGIHGTDRPDLIPGRVSHGCVRVRNPDIRTLARQMPVGTPVRIF